MGKQVKRAEHWYLLRHLPAQSYQHSIRRNLLQFVLELVLVLVVAVLLYGLVLRNRRELLRVQQAQFAEQQSNRAKDGFLASISHELRTPLTAIIGNSDLLAESPLDHEQHSQLRAIKLSGNSLLTMVNDVIDLSKAESGELEIHYAPFDLNVLLEQARVLYQQQADNSGLQLRVSPLRLEDNHLLGDGQRISQVLNNLLGNAIKFTDEGSITVSASVVQEHLSVVVEDTGIGIPEHELARLFTPLEQVDKAISRRCGGIGLGLYLSITLARHMGGEISVQSEEGKGSTFALTIPYRVAQQREAVSDQPAPTPQPVANVDKSATAAESDSSPHYRGKVLVAEDTKVMQMLLRKILQRMGVTVILVENGKLALERAQSEPFDLILMDMQMPVMDGIEATAALRKAGNQVPIAALTANVMEKNRQDFFDAGCNRFLTKPVNVAQLREVLDLYLLPLEPAEKVVDEELTQLFRSQLQESIGSLSATLAGEEWEPLRLLAQNIRGSAATFGYRMLGEQSDVLCSAVERKELERLPLLVESLIAEMKKILGDTGVPTLKR